ncbi:MAG: SIS domain-containing protein [Erysipelotrichaceae bacterium]|nr:SIS domain-containing protein [Erysipelotrichaceae bacterium]
MELFESIMWKYIGQEYQVLTDNIRRTDIEKLAEKLACFDTIYFVSHGSSYNASMTVMPFFMKNAGVNVHCITAGNFISSETLASLIDNEKTLVVLISQTGNSRGTLQAAQLAEKHGIKTLGISADDTATLKKYTDYFLTLNCGEEDSNAKTKGMSSTILVLLMLASCIGTIRGTITPEEKVAVYRELQLQCAELDDFICRSIQFSRENSVGKNMKDFYIVGSGMNYGLALEAQIKMMETMCIPTCAVDSEEFSHGTHRSINRDTTMLVIRTGRNATFAQSIYDYFNKLANVIMIETFPENRQKNVISITDCPLTESVMLIVAFIQVISAFAPEYNHQDPNRDANNDFTDLVDTRI